MIGPLVSVTALLSAAIVSSRANDARSAQQLGALVVLPLTAVFVANDQMALGLLRTLHEAGREVPRDLSVVGFDDIPEAAFFTPPLTTVRQDFAELGRRCLHLLLGRIEGERAQTRVVVAPELVVRASTAARDR